MNKRARIILAIFLTITLVLIFIFKNQFGTNSKVIDFILGLNTGLILAICIAIIRKDRAKNSRN
jgi:uncharacterized membrane protein